jgi:hypothetical protein
MMWWTELYFKIRIIGAIVGCALTGIAILFMIFVHLQDEGWLTRRKP